MAICLVVVTHVRADSLLTINDPQSIEGQSGTTTLNFLLSLSEAPASPISVDFYTAGVSATAGVDFVSTNGTTVFNAGETSTIVSVNIIGDLMNEADEIFWLQLTNPVGLLLLDNRGDGTILNDDPLPSLAISGETLVEGNLGQTNATFRVSLSSPSGQSVTVHYTTQSGAAAEGADFLPIAGSFTLTPGETNASILVSVTGDLLDENDESFSLALTNALNATLPPLPATTTILDDDALPELTVADVTLLEGTGGNTPVPVPLSLSAPSGRSLSVNFQTIANTATGGSDFVATNGILMIAPGITNLTIPLQVIADSNVELNEDFFLRLSNPTNVSLIRTQALASILDDETRTLAFTNAAPIAAALSGAADPYPTPIEISGLVGNVVKVTATLAGVSHSFPDDFDILLVGPLGQTVMLLSDCGGANSVNNLTLTFDDSAPTEAPDNATLATGTFRPSDNVTTDVLAGPAPGGPYGGTLSVFNGLNPNGTWSLYAFDDSAGGAGAIASGWQLNITVSNLVCCPGGNSDLSATVFDSPDPVTTTSNLTFTARIINNGPAGATGTVFTNTLPAGVNLISATTTHGTLTTNATQVYGNLGTLGLGVQATVTLVVRPTSVGYKTNAFFVTSEKTDPDLTNNLALTPSFVNQLAPLITVSDASAAEGDWGLTNLLFNVSLSRTGSVPVSAAYSTVAGSATDTSDFQPASGVVVFSPGLTNVTVAVKLIGDITIEPNESFTLQLGGVTNALIADGVATGTIQNDDGLPLRMNSFSWNAIGATQYTGIPFPATITARDVSNNVATTFTGPANISAITGSGPDVSIVIAEMDTDANDSVEFANVSGAPVDISGWQITLYDWFRWPEPAATFVVPASTICNSNQVFTLTDNGAVPGVFPGFSLGENIFWTNDQGTNMVAVLLRDADGRLIDFVCAVDADPTLITQPISIPSNAWTGSPIAPNLDPALTYRRGGNSDSQSAADFTTGTTSVGTMNSGLILPFNGTRPLAATPSQASGFNNGVWSGNISILQTAGSARMRASDVPGHVGVSGNFAIIAPPNLAVTLSASSTAVISGQPITFTISATNVGGVPANAVLLTNTLPTGFSFASAGTSQGTFAQNSGVVVFSLGTLSAGANATATVTATALTGGTFTNFAQIASSAPEAFAADNTAQMIVSANTPPALLPPGTQFVNEGSTTLVTNVVTDPDVPQNVQTFTLLAGPPGSSVTANGVFSWTTSETDGPGTNVVTVKVQDNGIPSLSATQSFAIAVAEINSQPQLAPVSTRFVLEGSTVLVTNIATDLDVPANTLNLSLLAPPAGATLSPNGVFTWTPSEAQGPGTFTIAVKVQDNGSPSLSTTQTFDVVVSEYNSPPVLFGFGNQGVNELTTLVLTNIATDPDIPTNMLTFQLLTAPTNATLSAAGVFTWTPNELQGPSTNTVSISLTDNGSPSISVTQFFTIIVAEVNTAPTLAPISSRTNLPGVTVTVTNAVSDPDAPTNAFTFTLRTAPLGAALSSNGVFTWTPTPAQGGSNFISISVSDNGAPSLSATQNFAVFVPVANTNTLRIEGIAMNPGFVSLQFSGPGGFDYLVESRPLSGSNWNRLTQITAPPTPLALPVRDAMSTTQKFYRVRDLTVPYQPPAIISRFASNGFFHLTFNAQAGRSYAVETRGSLGSGSWILLTNTTLASANVPMSYNGPGIEPSEFRVTRYSLPAPAQRIERIERAGTNVTLRFTLAPGLPAKVEHAASVASPAWLTLTNLPAFTNQVWATASDSLASSTRFYRLNFTVPRAPVTFTSQTSMPPAMQLWFSAASNKTYSVEYRNTVASGLWQTLTSLPVFTTNSTRSVFDPATSQPQRFYRVREQ